MNPMDKRNEQIARTTQKATAVFVALFMIGCSLPCIVILVGAFIPTGK